MKIIVFLLFGLCSIAKAQPITLSEKATISVITFGPWQGELYSAFGHSGFRVHDPVQEIDWLYNYGVFDFDQPNFYGNFAKGIPYYKLGIGDFQRYADHYIYYNRFVHEQILNLNPIETQKVFDYLQWNALPENANYVYDYFYDNCATRMRDVMITVFKDSVKFDGSYVKNKYSIRDLTDIYLKQQPWGDLGIDVCLGLPMDKEASPYEYMFLPDYIESGFDHATLNHDGTLTSIVKEKISIYESRAEVPDKGLPHPLYVFTGFALITLLISLMDLRRKKLSTWFDIILFGIVGLTGILLLGLWLFTNHKAAAYNFNLLWAFPTHFIIVFAFIKNPKWLEKYFLVVSIISALLLGLWFFLPQKLNVSLIPLVVALLARTFAQFKVRKLKKEIM